MEIYLLLNLNLLLKYLIEIINLLLTFQNLIIEIFLKKLLR